MKSFFIRIVLIVVFIILIGIMITSYFNNKEINRKNQDTIQAVTNEINQNVFETIQNNLQGLISFPPLYQTILRELPPDNQDILIYLKLLKNITGSSIVYILDNNGTVVACTPYDDHQSLTGNNYAFRPYFAKAMKGEPVIYGALGITTGKRGFYISIPIHSHENDEIIGVVVAKMNLESIDKIFQNQKSYITLLSPQGIVFASNNKDWMFKSGYRLNESEINKIKKSKQFVNHDLEPLEINLEESQVIYENEKYKIKTTSVLHSNWKVVALFPRQRVSLMILFLVELFLLTIVFSIIITIYSLYQLKENEKRFRSFYNATPDAIILFDEKKILSCNQSAVSMFGCKSEEEFCKQSLVDFSSVNQPNGENSRLQAKEFISKAIQKENLYFEWIFKRSDNNKEFIADVILTSIHLNNKLILEATIRDISDQKKIRNDLVASEKRLNLAISIANDGIWDWNMTNNSVIYDDRYYTIAGYKPKEFPSNFSEWEKRVHPEDLENSQNQIENYLNGETKEYKSEFRFRHKNGSYIWILARGRIVEHDEQYNPTRFVGTHSDITERKQAKIQLEKTLEETEKLNKLMIGREHRVVEMKKEVNELLTSLNRDPKYRSVE